MRILRFPIFILPVILAGCALENNRIPTTSEADSLGQITPLTSGFARIAHPSLSNDLKWMIFQGMRAGDDREQMYLSQIRAGDDGLSAVGVPLRISPNDSGNSSGRFSPDGISLIFASTAGNTIGPPGQQFSAAIEIFRADNWQGAVAASVPGMITDLAQHPLTSNTAYDAECAYSPDGKWIIFTSARDGDPELYVMRADGSSARRLTFRRGYDGEASFSPDGLRIVYRADNEDRQLICTARLVLNSAGEIIAVDNRRILTRDAGINHTPAWHPDSRHIIYASGRGDPGNDDLWLMRDDGNAKTRITFDNGSDSDPTFSADGRYLIWSSQRSGGNQLVAARFEWPRGS